MLPPGTMNVKADIVACSCGHYHRSRLIISGNIMDSTHRLELEIEKNCGICGCKFFLDFEGFVYKRLVESLDQKPTT